MLKMPKMAKMPNLSTNTKFSIWFTVALVVIIALLIVLIVYSNTIRGNTNDTESYLVNQLNKKDAILNQLYSQYNTNKGDNINNHSYTAKSGTVYYGPQSANSTIGTGAAIQSYSPPYSPNLPYS